MLVIATGVLIGTVVPASAQTIKPQGACAGDPGPFIEVTYDYGNVYHVVSGPWNDDNGTSSKATDQFSNTWSGTVSGTWSASLQVSGSILAASVKADTGISVTVSGTISGAHTVTYTISPHTTLHAEYAEIQRYTADKQYYQNSGCALINQTDFHSYLDEGPGWHTWVTAG